MATDKEAVKLVHTLVLDANPILRNEPPVSTLLAQSERLYTIPAVVDEIRDATARARLETTLLPFLTLRTPTPASVKIITDFARRTGDLEVLSRPDIQILALAYELECERNHGDWRLRSMPGQKRTNGPPPASVTGKSPEPSITSEGITTETTSEPLPDAARSKEGDKPQRSNPSKLEQEEHIQLTTADSTSPAQEALKSLNLNSDSKSTPIDVSAEVAASDDSEGSDDEGWITPSNIKKVQEKDGSAATEPQAEPKTMQVATITQDFAMQNVLLRMNLNLLSSSMQTIRQLRTWVLRCHACFDITKDMSKQFCGRCGKPTLLRTSCSTDKDGNFKVHLKKNMQWNTRGDVYSIPKPIAGSSNGKITSGGGKGGWGQSLILAEDQKEYVQAMTSARRKKEKDLMDEDYLPNILSGDRRGPGGKPRVGAGKSVNSKKRH